MKKKVLVICTVVICVLVVGIFIFAGMGISSHTGLYLHSDNGSHLIIMDNSPIVMSDRENEDMFKNLTDGDRILIFHDSIQESYPGRTLVYAYLKLSDGELPDIPENVIRDLCELGWLSAENLIICDNTYSSAVFDVSSVMSYSMFDDEKIKLSAINADKMNDEEVSHMPVFKFDAAEELNTFMTEFDEKFDSGYSDADDFRKALKDFDDGYFEDKSVILVFSNTGASNVSKDVKSVYSDGETFRLNFSMNTHGDGGLAVMSSWLTVIGVEKRFIGDCSCFDAVIQQ